MKIIFLGTPDFAVESLQRLTEEGFRPEAVVTMPDKPAGRGHKLLQSPVKLYALEQGIPVLQPRNLKDPAFQEELRAFGADLFVVIAFRMLPETVWRMPRLGTFNLHASLLPRYRGAAPINHAVMNGDRETGVTTFFLKHEIDTGDIIDQVAIPIGEDEDVESVHDRLMALGADLVVKTVREIERGEVKTRPQPEGEFIPAPKIFKETCRIPEGITVARTHNFVRGLSPYPAAWTLIPLEDGKELNCKVFRTSLHPLPLSEGDSEWIARGKSLLRRCSDGYIEVLELQPAGKRRMSADEFLRGYKIK